jgi:putative ABC transport system permease protein
MIAFLIKGLLRDRSRSLFPLITVTVGVALVTLGESWVNGALTDMVDNNARLETGHVKVVTQAYKEQMSSYPNDLALLNADAVIEKLESMYPDMEWVPRIRFGGLLDVADKEGVTLRQVRGAGLAVDFSEERGEIKRLDLDKILIRGTLPRSDNELLLSTGLAENLQIDTGDEITLISSSMYGSMVIHNFIVSGIIRFGIVALDRNMMIAPIGSIRYALNMEDAVGEIFGYFKNPDDYSKESALKVQETFNRKMHDPDDEFSPYMLTLRNQNFLEDILSLYENVMGVFIFIFVFIMFIVLWNAGLMNGIRRYGEMGLRLAIGESANHIYLTSIGEALLVGLGGSIIGISLGLACAWYLQTYGVDITEMIDSNTLYMSNVIRAYISTSTYYIGFIPGLLATGLGAVVSGRGIYKRQTAQLFKELEV